MGTAKQGVPCAWRAETFWCEGLDEATLRRMVCAYTSEEKYVISVVAQRRAEAQAGYRRRGYISPQRALSVRDIREIRLLRQMGLTLREIARRFDVGQTTIFEIVHRRRYAEVA